MNSDDRNILSHVLNRMIIVVSPYSRKDGSSNIALLIHVLCLGQKARAKYYRICMNKDYSMYYISNTRSMTREYLDILDLIKKEKLFVAQFYSMHYEGLRLESIPSREPLWPEIESHNIFHLSVDKKLCPIYNLLTCTKEPSIYYCLYRLWVHYNDDSLYKKY